VCRASPSVDKPEEAPIMSSTIRDAAEHSVHTLTDRVGEVMHHVELPHIDLARVTGRRRTLSPAMVVAIVAAVMLTAVVAARVMRGRRTSAVVLQEVIDEPSEKGKKARVAA
jgi:hypothetical protein